jgi:hypothetical protein
MALRWSANCTHFESINMSLLWSENQVSFARPSLTSRDPSKRLFGAKGLKLESRQAKQ